MISIPAGLVIVILIAVFVIGAIGKVFEKQKDDQARVGNLRYLDRTERSTGSTASTVAPTSNEAA